MSARTRKRLTILALLALILVPACVVYAPALKEYPARVRAHSLIEEILKTREARMLMLDYRTGYVVYRYVKRPRSPNDPDWHHYRNLYTGKEAWWEMETASNRVVLSKKPRAWVVYEEYIPTIMAQRATRTAYLFFEKYRQPVQELAVTFKDPYNYSEVTFWYRRSMLQIDAPTGLQPLLRADPIEQMKAASALTGSGYLREITQRYIIARRAKKR